MQETSQNQPPWHASYPPGISDQAPGIETQTICALLEKAVEKHGTATALSAMGRNISYLELDRHTQAVAGWLLEQGFRPGDHIAVMLPNVLAHPIAYLGIARAGMTAVCLNPLYTIAEVSHAFRSSPVRAVIVFEPMAHIVQQARVGSDAHTVVVVSPGAMLGWKKPLVNLVARHLRGLVPWYLREGTVAWDLVLNFWSAHGTAVSPTPQDHAVMLYSGGTTGQPKGVPLTHAGLTCNVAQQDTWISSSLDPDRTYTLMLAIPLYHILGFGSLLFCIFRGGKAVLVMNPRDQKQFVREWARHQVTSFPGVNTLFASLLSFEAFSRLDFAALRFALGAGMPVQERTAQQWKSVTGCEITEGYGLTETGLVACNRIGASRIGSVGLPIPGVDISLRGDGGETLGLADTGEICIRGGAVLRGYWASAENTTAFTEDGFFKTGDIGTFDADGFLRLVDRKKEMIISSGFKIYPSEVERVLLAHPEVVECAVAPAIDLRAGEIPVAYVVSKEDSLTADELLNFCEAKLVAYKRPRRIIFLSELPKSSVGKILRRQLQEKS